MVLHPEDLISPGPLPEPGDRPVEGRDPLAFAVRLALVVYLSPVFLIVFLIGGTSIVAGAMARGLRHAGPRPVDRAIAGPKLAGRDQGNAMTRATRQRRGTDLTR